MPQISVRLDRQSPAHLQMLRFWLGFWREHRDALLDGELAPLHPELLYPVVIASTPRERVVAAYCDLVLDPGPGVPQALYVVNATAGDRVVLDLSEDLGPRDLVVRDCRGEVVRRDEVLLGPGLHGVAVPPSGLVALVGRV